ncbi:MAG: DUF177 domain-containing protein [Pseudomonadota bacterium]
MIHTMPETPPSLPSLLVLDRLDSHRPTKFDLAASAQEMARIAKDLGLLGLAKLRFAGEIAPKGAQSWQVRATLGATATQACVVTLAPVKTRIDQQVTRRYVPEAQMPTTSPDSETELDDETDPIPDQIDLWDVAAEALALALPDYPKATEAPQDGQVFGPKGVAPMTDEEARPFAALAALKSKMTPDG